MINIIKRAIKHSFYCVSLAVFYFFPVVAYSDRQLDLYFSNDSMNGFQLSDAYETHDMGIRYSSNKNFIDLNLALVSPDMYVYRNQYREANRSYGEVITLSWGIRDIPGYFKFSTIGRFGLDTAQDFAHRVFSLQSVAKVNNLIRMPDAVHFGYGYKWKLGDMHTGPRVSAYLGSDRAAAKYNYNLELYKTNELSVHANFGAQYVAFDNVVSAKPISAQHRTFIPEATLILKYSLSETVNLLISDQVSLPSIAEDNNLFAKFSAGLSYNF